ncbi:MAG: trypsin-like peptidase domain-containing protein, partial [Bacteroidota bacterium]
IDLPNGDRVWLLGVYAENAKSINLAFDQFHLQSNSKLFIYSEDHQHLLGAFTQENNADDGLFATYPIPGERIIIELYEPLSDVGNNQLKLETITHAYRDLDKVARDIGDSGTCNNNVICTVGNPWENEIRSVAMVVVGSNGICTGALVNNTASDGHPYFLTADHCTGGGVTNWVFRFNWQSTTCAGNNVGTFQTVNGSQMLAQGNAADYALLEINNGNAIPASTNCYFAGWDATGVNPTEQVGIHHPSGDLKKISFDTDAAGTANFGGAICWRIFDWEDGTTEPGSSGSPLFDQNHRIIGQLFGGQASCANNINDYYGKFDVTYPNVCQWLAPGCNTQIVDGYDPFAPSVSLDAQLQSVTEPSGSYCTSTVTPTVNIRNAGTTTLTSLTINYNVDGGTNNTFNWTGSLASSASAAVTLPAVTTADGSHTFNVSVSNPNGGTDENTANDSGQSNFSTTSNGINWTFTLLTDDYPAETSWEIVDGSNTVLFSGNGYSQTQTTFVIDGCLAAGCYQLNVFDTFGDGLQYQGVVGNYTLEDEFGNVLAEMVAGGNFGAEANHPFCLESPNVDGCTDAGACNYDPSATNDDGSCEFLSCAGCTNGAACNYDPTATIDNGSCVLPDGCTDSGACNYDMTAQCDNGSCEYLSCVGCTDSGACNYDASATQDDGTCEYISCAGCTDSGACNYDLNAIIEDQSCVYPTTYYADSDNDT